MSRADRERVDQILTMFGGMKSVRQQYTSIWQQVACFESDYPDMFSGVLDNSYAMMEKNPRDLDNSARRAVRIYSAGMLSGVTPLGVDWFRLVIPDRFGGEDLAKYPPVSAWLEKVQQIFSNDFTQKNFYSQMATSYSHLGLFGMQGLLVGEDSEVGTYYKAIPPDELYIAEDNTGRVNTVFREIVLTMQQACELFGLDNLSPARQDAIKSKNANMQDTMIVLHAIVPKKPGYENIQGSNKLPFASYYLEESEEHFISEGGYNSLPYIVTRAYSNGRSPYSVSSGTLCLADVKYKNELKALLLESAQLRVAPPYLTPDRGLVQEELDYRPFAMNLYRKNQQIDVKDFVPLQLGGDINLGMELLTEAQNDINAAFFVDIFMMINARVQQSGTPPTAAEIRELAQEKSFLLNPVLSNQQQENLDNVFSRQFEIMLEHKQIPPWPRELNGIEPDIDYYPPLFMAQQEARAQKQMQNLSPMIEMAMAMQRPDLLDIIDFDAFIRQALNNLNFPGSCQRTKEMVAQMRQARDAAQQQAQQQAQQAAMLQGAMSGYKDLSQAPQEGSAAAMLMGGGGVPTMGGA